MPRDVTAILMGDPGTHPRRAPTEQDRKRHGAATSITVARVRITSWVKSVQTAPVGWEARGLSYYAARKAWLVGKSAGMEITYEQQPGTNVYTVRRVK